MGSWYDYSGTIEGNLNFVRDNNSTQQSANCAPYLPWSLSMLTRRVYVYKNILIIVHKST